MPRYYRRRYRIGVYPRKRYSNETMTSTGQFDSVANDQQAGDILASGKFGIFPKLICIPSSNVQGMRKVKNFTLTISPSVFLSDGTNFNCPIRFALVYVPQGQDPGNLNIGAGINSLYEPNQNVIMSGAFMSNENFKVRSYLSRNLNSGDQIMLLMAGQSYENWSLDISSNMAITLNYAIAY